MYQIRIEFTFDSGHRLLDYNGRCAYPHGHGSMQPAPNLVIQGNLPDYGTLVISYVPGDSCIELKGVKASCTNRQYKLPIREPR